VPILAFLRGILLRSLVIWVSLRVALFLFHVGPPALPTRVGIVLVTAFLTTFDGRRHGETLFLANLGIPEWRLAAVAAVLPLLLESIMWLALSA